jgi:hypothetical protein
LDAFCLMSICINFDVHMKENWWFSYAHVVLWEIM